MDAYEYSELLKLLNTKLKNIKGILKPDELNKRLDEIKEEDFYKVETYFGKFSRSFTLPDNADIENIEASLDCCIRILSC